VRPFDFQNKRHLRIGATLFLSLITIFIIGVRVMKNRDNEERGQREWYSKQLHYEFGTKADTVINLKQRWGYGEIYFTDPEGRVDLAIEDSLNTAMDSKIRFITQTYGGRLKFVIQNSTDYLTGDSLYVDAKKNQILIFRDRKLISEHQISSSLTTRWFR
jgi:hypothetical protein